MKKYPISVVFFVALCVVAIYAFVLFNHDQYVPISNAATSTSEVREYVPKNSGREVPVGQAEYYAQKYHISLLYPDTLKVQEYTEIEGEQTATFQYDDGKTIAGFQIFVAPFSDSQITPERFKKDEPSGVRIDSKSITIDGATGASFFSKNAALGDTAEVWFVHNGYLYEVTTFRELAPWLSQIMESWKFIPQ